MAWISIRSCGVIVDTSLMSSWPLMASRTHSYSHLLAEGQIGEMTLRNRVIMPAMDQNLCTSEGAITDALIAHYEERAAGGAALLILETSAVAYPMGATTRYQPAVSTDECIRGLSELSQRVHAHGAKFLVQLCHHGKTASIDAVEGRALLVPSLPMPELDPTGMMADLTMDEMMKMGAKFGGKRPTYEAATTDQLAWVVDQFAAAAARVERAGCDGIEIHGCHGYLVSTFLSPCFNQRDDEYGGSSEGRARLLREIIEAIRSQTGSGFTVVARIDGAEFRVPRPGITPELAAEHAQIAEAAGADAIHVSAVGSPDSAVGFTDGPLPWQPLQYRDLAATVKRAVAVPVIAVGRVQPQAGDALIADGYTDFVAMGRQLLADAELPNRLMAGTPELIRPCINCFVCVAENFFDGTPGCAVNARLGRRGEADASPADESRRVIVVGGGPGGMEAARVASMRGHRVTLLEMSRQLGGTARFSSLTTPINADLVSYLEASLRAQSVDVRLGHKATDTSVKALDPDVVVVATGAKRDRPAVKGADLDHVLSGDDLRGVLTGDNPGAVKRLGRLSRLVLRMGHRLRVTRKFSLVRSMSRRWMPIGTNVTIVGGGLVGIELAEFLAERKRSVTVLEEGSTLGTEMAHPRRWRALHEARTRGVVFVTGAELSQIDHTHVHYRAGEEGHSIPADNVIVASGVRPDLGLASQLESLGIETHAIGDAAEVGYIEGAIRSGHDLAIRI